MVIFCRKILNFSFISGSVSQTSQQQSWPQRQHAQEPPLSSVSFFHPAGWIFYTFPWDDIFQFFFSGLRRLRTASASPCRLRAPPGTPVHGATSLAASVTFTPPLPRRFMGTTRCVQCPTGWNLIVLLNLES